MATICGIDEAGRGPVIGPLVLCGVLIKEEEEQKFKALELKDSKLILPNKRKSLVEPIKKIGEYHLIEVSPMEIDAAVESKETNLNWLEADHMAEIINVLKPNRAYVDCPSTNIAAFTAYVKKKLTVECTIIAEHKADVKYVVVSAASILAKVARDQRIEEIQKKFTVPVGSGYPSDPATVNFLKSHYQSHPEIFRHSWASYKRLAGEKEQKKLGEF